MTHPGGDTIRKRLPSMLEIGHNFANVDITKEPIPVVPMIHYQMGGVPSINHVQMRDLPGTVVEDPYRLLRCHRIMNCVDVCPKGLNPTRAIGKIKELMVRRTA